MDIQHLRGQLHKNQVNWPQCIQTVYVLFHESEDQSKREYYFRWLFWHKCCRYYKWVLLKFWGLKEIPPWLDLMMASPTNTFQLEILQLTLIYKMVILFLRRIIPHYSMEAPITFYWNNRPVILVYTYMMLLKIMPGNSISMLTTSSLPWILTSPWYMWLFWSPHNGSFINLTTPGSYHTTGGIQPP